MTDEEKKSVRQNIDETMTSFDIMKNSENQKGHSINYKAESQEKKKQQDDK
jgi:hypothetical protein